MLRRTASLCLILICVGSSSAAEPQIVRFDFGSQPADGWNPISQSKNVGLLLSGAVDQQGEATSVALRQQDGWAGSTVKGPTDAERLPANVSSDSFYLEAGVDTSARLDIEGLQPGAAYVLALFGSRLGEDAKRVGVYQAGGKTAELDAADNRNRWVEWKSIAADDRGLITVRVQCPPGQDFAYLNALQIQGEFGVAREYVEPPEDLDGPPLVTAKAWAIADGKSGELLWGENESRVRNMASTTKMMTAWIVLELAAKDADVLQETVVVSERADKTGGSTAGVQAGEQLPVADLLYGLLLPSGNDAAVALAEHFGDRLPPRADAKESDDSPLERFVAEMNRRAAALGMQETHYFDPHGNSANRSSARDLLKLVYQAMQNEKFRGYVRTREHRCQLRNGDRMREVVWKNTNQLLRIAGYEGVKTGTTGGAGACLVSSGRRRGDHLYVVVLGSTSSDARYTDSRNLYRWAWRQRIGQ